MKAFLYCIIAALLGAAIAGVRADDAPMLGLNAADDGVESLSLDPEARVAQCRLLCHFTSERQGASRRDSIAHASHEQE